MNNELRRKVPAIRSGLDKLSIQLNTNYLPKLQEKNLQHISTPLSNVINDLEKVISKDKRRNHE
jgi:hypothetical protein